VAELVCKHGNKVQVQVEPVSRICWDGGIESFTKGGNRLESGQDDKGRRFLQVQGCPWCQTVEWVLDR